MEVREIKATELDSILHIGRSFPTVSKLVKVDLEVAKKNIADLIDKKIGIAFGLWDGSRYVGAICGIKYPDLMNGTMTALECFWFVSPAHRGNGTMLLKCFEQWAIDEGCQQIIMVALADCMPEQVARIYSRYGYEELETHYIKELN